jgi:hypothetical protein
MSSMHRARGALHEGTPAAVPAVLGREVLTFDPPASGQSIRPPWLEMPEMLPVRKRRSQSTDGPPPTDHVLHPSGSNQTQLRAACLAHP